MVFWGGRNIKRSLHDYDQIIAISESILKLLVGFLFMGKEGDWERFKVREREERGN